MLLLLTRKMFSCTFEDLYGLVGYYAFTLNGHLICSAERCFTWLYFDSMIFVDLVEKGFAET